MNNDELISEFCAAPPDETRTIAMVFNDGSPNPSGIKEALSWAEALIGESDFPALCHEIASSYLECSESHRKQLKELFSRRALVFFADHGRGYNEALRILAILLTHLSFFPNYSQSNTILKVIFESENQVSIDTILDALAGKKAARSDDKSSTCITNTLISLDFTAIPTFLTKPKFLSFLISLRDLVKHSNNIVVFRLPYMAPDAAQDTTELINRILTTKSVFFKSLTDDDILAMADRFFDSVDCRLSGDAQAAFMDLVNDARNNGYLYGSHTVRKLVDDILSYHSISQRSAEPTITTSDIMHTPGYEYVKKAKSLPSTMEEVLAPLNEMVGMEEISRKVKSIIYAVQRAQATNQPMDSLHMVLYGNPGTGKTTVARVIAAALKHSGVLSVGKCVEVTAADLVGEYVGQTQPKTRALCQSAYGSVLFIDEAYTLVPEDKRSSFGPEALGELISQMENHRDDFVVIMAGYQDDMERLLRVNPGLDRRLKYHINIPFCSAEQLYAIYMQQLNSRKKKEEKEGAHLDWDADFQQAVKTHFYSIPQSVLSQKHFGNGGYARNLLEQTITQAVARTAESNQGKFTLDLCLTAADFAFAIRNTKMD